MDNKTTIYDVLRTGFKVIGFCYIFNVIYRSSTSSSSKH